MEPRVIPGIYRHYKGAHYLALGTVVWHDAKGEGKPGLFVCYICLYENNTETNRAEQCVRPIEEWTDTVYGPSYPIEGIPRYKLLTPLGP